MSSHPDKFNGASGTPKFFLPTSPFERRTARLSLQHCVPPLGTPAAADLQQLMAMDIGFQLKFKAMQRRYPHFMKARLKTGSGLQLANLLRSYLLEFDSRYRQHGPGSFPSSFNVVESFMSFDRQNFVFDLREEVEHLLSIDDYFNWYDKGEIPRCPGMLADIMKEGVIYSYDMISDKNSFRISGQSQQVFAGVSFVRHELELSCIFLAGENPPLISDKKIKKVAKGKGIGGREGILISPLHRLHLERQKRSGPILAGL